MGSLPSTLTTLIWSLIERTSTKPMAPGVVSTSLSTSSSESTVVIEPWCAAINDFSSLDDILSSRSSVAISPLEFLCRTRITSLPSCHFFTSKRKILARWADPTSPTLLSLLTTTAMWCAKQGSSEHNTKANRQQMREGFIATLHPKERLFKASRFLLQKTSGNP